MLNKKKITGEYLQHCPTACLLSVAVPDVFSFFYFFQKFNTYTTLEDVLHWFKFCCIVYSILEELLYMVADV